MMYAQHTTPMMLGENGSSNTSSPHGVLLQNCREGPGWPEGVCIFANLCGLTSTCIWFIVLFPQIWKNWRRKSVQGLSVLWATANFTASLVNLFFVFSVSELPWYVKVDAVYMPTLEITILVQFVVYGLFSARAKMLYGAVCLTLWSIIISVELTVDNVQQKVQWVAITLWCIETFPQVMLNMKLHSTHGQSTPSVIISLIGKATDFMSTYLLVMPVQNVIMAYFSSTMAYVNGVQVAWYVKSSDPENVNNAVNANKKTYRSYTDNIDPDFSEEDLEAEGTRDTDEMIKSATNTALQDPKKKIFWAWLRIIILVFLTLVLLAFIIGLLWNVHSLLALLAPAGIILILGCSYIYYNWWASFTHCR